MQSSSVLRVRAPKPCLNLIELVGEVGPGKRWRRVLERGWPDNDRQQQGLEHWCHIAGDPHKRHNCLVESSLQLLQAYKAQSQGRGNLDRRCITLVNAYCAIKVRMQP